MIGKCSICRVGIYRIIYIRVTDGIGISNSRGAGIYLPALGKAVYTDRMSPGRHIGIWYTPEVNLVTGIDASGSRQPAKW